jgi:hypothetical protein
MSWMGETQEASSVGRRKASSDDWNAYYEAADRLRVVVGDPYKRYAERKSARERMLLIASCLIVVMMAAAFVAMAASP